MHATGGTAGCRENALDPEETLLVKGIVPRLSSELSASANGKTLPALPGTPWRWLPTLYFAEGWPYATAMIVSVILYKQLGISNARAAFYTSWLYLPWVIKPFWGPLVDILGTRRRWIWSMQLVMGSALAGIALTLPTTKFFQLSLAFFWLLAFSSATHDIAADGFYMLALVEQEQSFFIGIRNTCFRVATIGAQGLLVILAGIIHKRTGQLALAWTAAFLSAAGLFMCFCIYHRFVLPRPAADEPGSAAKAKSLFAEFFRVFGDFFRKPEIPGLLAFMLFYRFGEAQLLKMVNPFLLDARQAGGLGLSAEQVGFVYGTIGVMALMLGGIAGGMVVSRDGLRRWLWPMVIIMHVPDAVFIFLSYAQPQSLPLIAASLAAEQFGYGFGFTAYMLYLIYVSRGPHQTAHYAICTGLMALGMMVPGLWSGWLQEKLGYPHFFLWIMLATIPGFIVSALISFEPEFGKRHGEKPS